LAAAVGAAMVAQGTGGSIITVASAAALAPLPDHYAYCASKAGLVMATKVLARELGRYGIRANSVCPTVVLTEMGQRVWGEEARAAPMIARIPLGRFAIPREVSDTPRRRPRPIRGAVAASNATPSRRRALPPTRPRGPLWCSRFPCRFREADPCTTPYVWVPLSDRAIRHPP
jgi:NAD(P)-dependent dehydrogenase (short-subunit alcohol dehydrogenase family)